MLAIGRFKWQPSLTHFHAGVRKAGAPRSLRKILSRSTHRKNRGSAQAAIDRRRETITRAGTIGLIATPRALVVYALGSHGSRCSAVDMPEAGEASTRKRVTPASHDRQKGYFDFWLNFVGGKEVRSLVVESTTWGGKEKGGRKHRAGQEGSSEIGDKLLGLPTLMWVVCGFKTAWDAH
jgi:hypothetical protein